MPTNNLLFKRQYPINDSIKIVIPTVGEILDNEDAYYGLVFSITAMPIDLMVQLDDMGIDFSTINEYELFLLMFQSLKLLDTSLVFGDLDLSKFEIAISKQNGNVILVDEQSGIVIDRAIYDKIATALRQIHHLEKNKKKPANKEAKEYLIKRARDKLRRAKSQHSSSQLESLIIAMVNTEQYKYNFLETRDLTIYQFNESVRQVINKIDYDNRMHGVYAGTVDVSKLSQKEMTWLINK